jgi:hypothetical protein
MIWVKAGERLPEKQGMYYGRIKGSIKEIIVFYNGYFYKEWDTQKEKLKMGMVEWLDEEGKTSST